MDIEKLCTISRLNLTDTEKDEIKKSLTSLQASCERLTKIDCTNEEPLISPNNIYAEDFREDEIKQTINPKDLMKNAPETDDDFFVAPKA